MSKPLSRMKQQISISAISLVNSSGPQKPKEEKRKDTNSQVRTNPCTLCLTGRQKKCLILKNPAMWLDKAGLKDSTEALITAARNKLLSIRSIKAQVLPQPAGL